MYFSNANFCVCCSARVLHLICFFSGFEIGENATQLCKRFTIEGIFGDGPFHSCFLLMLMLDPHSELQQILHFHGCYKVVTKQ